MVTYYFLRKYVVTSKVFPLMDLFTPTYLVISYLYIWSCKDQVLSHLIVFYTFGVEEGTVFLNIT